MTTSEHVFYRSPARIYPIAERARGIYIYDSDGNQYLDGSSGALVSNIGHGVREVTESIATQLSHLDFAHTSMFTTYPQEEFAAALTSMAKGNLSRVYFVSGGSEANEAAIKMARQYHLESGNHSKHKVIGRWMSYHGSTLGTLSVSGNVPVRRNYDPYLLRFPHIPPPYCYRCPYGDEEVYPSCALKCAYALEEMIVRTGQEYVSAFIAETVVGSSNAALTPPKEYFQVIREVCDKFNVLLIMDEVMSGSGRTGEYFAIDHWDVVPDMITAGKGLGCGYVPLGAVLAKAEIFNTIRNGSGKFIHGHTYQGNPLACTVGNTVLKFIQDNKLLQNAADKGEYLHNKLEELRIKHSIIGDVRGKGLMLGLEFVQNLDTKEPFPTELKLTQKLLRQRSKRGLLFIPAEVS